MITRRRICSQIGARERYAIPRASIDWTGSLGCGVRIRVAEFRPSFAVHRSKFEVRRFVVRGLEFGAAEFCLPRGENGPVTVRRLPIGVNLRKLTSQRSLGERDVYRSDRSRQVGWSR